MVGEDLDWLGRLKYGALLGFVFGFVFYCIVEVGTGFIDIKNAVCLGWLFLAVFAVASAPSSKLFVGCCYATVAVFISALVGVGISYTTRNTHLAVNVSFGLFFVVLGLLIVRAVYTYCSESARLHY